jgi:F-type H+-transporting ATPase subunit b
MIAESIFLLPNGTFFVELAVFLILLGAIWKWGLPPLNAMLEKRQEQIRTSLEAADRAKAEADAAGDERERLLSETRNQAREIVANAQATSDQIKSEQAARGQAEYDRIVGAAAGEVTAVRQRAIDEASARIGEVVFELVTKIVGREVDQSAHQDLVRDAVSALNAEAPRGAGV